VPLGGAFGSDPGHWSESAFGNELMTPFLDRGINPLSLITLEALADLGYQTSAVGAEPYARYLGVPPGAPAAARLPSWGFRLAARRSRRAVRRRAAAALARGAGGRPPRAAVAVRGAPTRGAPARAAPTRAAPARGRPGGRGRSAAPGA
jgi:hypothetical protein